MVYTRLGVVDRLESSDASMCESANESCTVLVPEDTRRSSSMFGNKQVGGRNKRISEFCYFIDFSQAQSLESANEMKSYSAKVDRVTK